MPRGFRNSSRHCGPSAAGSGSFSSGSARSDNPSSTSRRARSRPQGQLHLPYPVRLGAAEGAQPETQRDCEVPRAPGVLARSTQQSAGLRPIRTNRLYSTPRPRPVDPGTAISQITIIISPSVVLWGDIATVEFEGLSPRADHQLDLGQLGRNCSGKRVDACTRRC